VRVVGQVLLTYGDGLEQAGSLRIIAAATVPPCLAALAIFLPRAVGVRGTRRRRLHRPRPDQGRARRTLAGRSASVSRTSSRRPPR
jgi:hypothetical protein